MVGNAFVVILNKAACEANADQNWIAFVIIIKTGIEL